MQVEKDSLKIDRYDLEWVGSAYNQIQSLVRTPDGEWCEYSDVEALEAKCSKLETQLSEKKFEIIRLKSNITVLKISLAQKKTKNSKLKF
jgi:predicted RNase H-like nuclease (RuvC/YqgF family)